MENWITYIAECALCLALLYLPFWGLLKKDVKNNRNDTWFDFHNLSYYGH